MVLTCLRNRHYCMYTYIQSGLWITRSLSASTLNNLHRFEWSKYGFDWVNQSIFVDRVNLFCQILRLKTFPSDFLAHGNIRWQAEFWHCIFPHFRRSNYSMIHSEILDYLWCIWWIWHHMQICTNEGRRWCVWNNTGSRNKPCCTLKWKKSYYDVRSPIITEKNTHVSVLCGDLNQIEIFQKCAVFYWNWMENTFKYVSRRNVHAQKRIKDNG